VKQQELNQVHPVVFTNSVEHSHADRLPYLGVADLGVFELHGLDGLDEVGVFPFDVDLITDIETGLGDFDDTHMEMRIVMGNLANEFFRGGHVTPPYVPSPPTLACEDMILLGYAA
jgi:hypothetical protein